MMGGMGISVDGLVGYVERAVDAMAGIVAGLGDEAANARPGLPGANSPYVILRHCLGVMEFWGGQVVAGRQVERDRDAEFPPHGPVPPPLPPPPHAHPPFPPPPPSPH